MEPGPELDKKVCDAVGIEPYEVYAPLDSFEECVLEYPPVSTDIGAAWQVAIKVSGGMACALINDDNRHWAFVMDGMQNTPLSSEPTTISTTFWVEAEDWRDTEALAICHAALKWAEDNG